MKKGFSPFASLFVLTARSMKSRALAVMSFSMVFMRSIVRGPVSLHFCLPTMPQRGSTVCVRPFSSPRSPSRRAGRTLP